MFVKVSATGAVTLHDHDNFRAFKLVVEGDAARLEDVRQTLAGTAELLDSSHAWIFEQALRQRPEVAQNQAWQGSLGTMIEKARPHGWIDDQKKAIKAHIEWVTPA
jgi:predicted transcriptional regulator